MLHLERTIYCKRDGFIYRVDSITPFEKADYIWVHLALVCGWDYLNEDTEVQGWVAPENFVKDVQTEIISQNFVLESLYDALEFNDFEIVENTKAFEKFLK